MRMKRRLRALLTLTALAGAAPAATIESERDAARRFAGADFASSLFLCDTANTRRITELMNTSSSSWLPVTQAFDNLWYIGNGFVGAWVLKTSAGIIIFDANQSETEIREHLEPGLRSIGLDPADIKYAIVTHGHWDHYGGSLYLQERYGTRVALSAADWTLLERSKPGSLERAPMQGADRADRPPPRRDMVVTDGQKLRLGDTELTLLVTPGHTPGTLSALIPVSDGPRRHVMSLLGGTAFPPHVDATDQFGGLLAFEQSVKRLADKSREVGASGLLNTHIFVDGSDLRLTQARARRPGDPNPFVLGPEKVGRYYAMFGACLRAAILRKPRSTSWTSGTASDNSDQP